ncbi:MAG: hypothetical protein IH624_15875 [Phycisphaerae bacterium]|nr:hypothetical protein [Phycisphaerae bacterium]
MHAYLRNADTVLKRVILSVAVLVGVPFRTAAAPVDATRYITLEEIHTDMDAWCLTVLEGTRVERFPLKILSIIRNYQPQRDAILVIGTDERFIHAGAIHGCSGSPVYINGRMAGALAAGWDGSKDPLYLVTPIEEMLAIGATAAPAAATTRALGIDLSGPIDLAAISDTLSRRTTDTQMPLATSLSASVCRELSPRLAAVGMKPVPAGGARVSGYEAGVTGYTPGSVLAVPLITGDIAMAAIGTVTEVADGSVYGFGHDFIGIGAVDLPMASGIVHTVVPGFLQAIKFAAAGPVNGAIRFDEAAGIRGRIDAVAKTIPLHIRVNRYNDPQERTYDCRLAVERLRTPVILQSAIVAAIGMRGSLPGEHTLRYKGVIAPEGFEPIVFENVSSGETYGEIAAEVFSTAALLLSNPYTAIDITSLDFDIAVVDENTRATIRTVTVSDTDLKPGGTLTVSVLLQGYMSELSLHHLTVAIPEDLRPGEYDVTVAGAYEYEKFIRKVAPYKFTAFDLATLVETLGDLLTIRRDRLYVAMALPAEGVTIKRSELPMLPASRAMLLSDAKRTIATQKYGRWIESSVQTDTVVFGGRSIRITVHE